MYFGNENDTLKEMAMGGQSHSTIMEQREKTRLRKRQ